LPPSQRLEISYTHHHILSFNTSTASSDNSSFSDQIKALKLSITSNSTGILHSSCDASNANLVSAETIVPIKTVEINGHVVRYDSTTLPDPPSLSYKVDQLETLVDDWDHSSFITIDGVGIPLCYWKKIYS